MRSFGRCFVFGDFVPQLRSIGEAATERRDEGVVSFARFCAGSLDCRLGQSGRCCQPESHEDGKRLDRDAEVALDPRQSPVKLVEPLGRDSFLSLGGVR